MGRIKEFYHDEIERLYNQEDAYLEEETLPLDEYKETQPCKPSFPTQASAKVSSA